MGHLGWRAGTTKAAGVAAAVGGCLELRMPTRPPGMDVGGGRPQGPHLCPDPPVCPILSQKAAGQTACPWERQRVAGRVRRLPSHPRAPTLQDLWVLFLPLGPLDCSRVPMGSVSLLLSWPQNSGDPVSEPATHHPVFQTLKSCPPTARFPRGGTGLREVQSLLEFTQNVGGRGDRLQAWD